MKIKRHLTHYTSTRESLKTKHSELPRKSKKNYKKKIMKLAIQLDKMCLNSAVIPWINGEGKFIELQY